MSLDKTTFDNAIDVWIPFVKKHCKPNTKLNGPKRDPVKSPQEEKRLNNISNAENLPSDVIEEVPSGGWCIMTM